MTAPIAAYTNPLPDAGSAATEWALDLMFGSRKAEAWVTPVIDTAIPSQWTGDRYATIGNDLQAKSHAGHYVCIALLKPGTTRRIDENVESVAGLVFDDVGSLDDPNTKMDMTWFQLRPEPTFVVETSERNFQFFFVFAKPVAPVEYRKLIEALKRCPETVGGIRDGTTASRYVRLPSGQNPKAGRGGFRTRLVEASGVKHDLAALMTAFGLESEAAGAAGAMLTGEGEASPEILHLPESEALALLAEAMALIRNYDIGREDWVGIVFAIWNASGESETSEEIAFDWTARREDGPVDAVKDLRDVWEHRRGTKAGLTTIVKWLRMQRTPAADAMVKRIGLTQARGVFDEIEDEEEAKGEPPAVLDWVAAKYGRTRTIQPTILPGLDKGLLTVIGGPSGVLKSTLLMHAAVAIACERADILGLEKIDYCGDVLVFANEDSEEITDKRLDAIQKRWRITRPDFKHKLYILEGQIFEKTPGRDGTFTWKEEAFDQIRKVARKTRADGRQLGLIAIDTLSSAAEGSEESNREMQAITNLTSALVKEVGAAGLFVHHLRKAGTGEKQKDVVEPGLDALRGGSALGNSVRNVLFMARPTKTDRDMAGWTEEDAKRFIKLRIVKRSYGPEGEPQWFRTETVPVPVIDPRDGSLHSETYLVLAANPIDAAAAHAKMLREAYDKIEAANKAGRELIATSKAGGSARSVQELLGKSDKETNAILDELARLGGVVFVERRDANRRVVRDVIATGKWESKNGEDEDNT